MNIRIIKKCDLVTTAEQEYAEAKITRVLRDLPKVVDVCVIFDSENYSKTIEVIIHAKQQTVLAKELADEFVIAIDLVEDKLLSQVRKIKDKVKNRRPRKNDHLDIAI